MFGTPRRSKFKGPAKVLLSRWRKFLIIGQLKRRRNRCVAYSSQHFVAQNAQIFDFDCLSGKKERTDYISYQADSADLIGVHRVSPS